MSSIGANNLPIAAVEVTYDSLPVLGEQPNVIAILPNQHISLIQPKAVNYDSLEREEVTDGLTWGLKQLNIPELWNTTKGKKILPVVAVGNENHGNSSSPGNAYNAFSIGAMEKNADGDLGIASFSSGASLVFPGTAHDVITKPDVSAPGVQVYSSIPPQKQPNGTFEYSYMGGTSMATPHISGVAALLMAAKPSAPITDIIAAMKDTAHHPLGQRRRPDNRCGAACGSTRSAVILSASTQRLQKAFV